MSKFEEEFFAGADFRAIYNEISMTLKQLREYRGLTIEEAAKRIGMQPDKLEAIENGQRVRSTAPLVHIVESLGARLVVVPEESKNDPHCQFIELED